MFDHGGRSAVWPVIATPVPSLVCSRSAPSGAAQRSMQCQQQQQQQQYGEQSVGQQLLLSCAAAAAVLLPLAIVVA